MPVLPFKILVLGASGMLGHTLFVRLLRASRYDVRATARRVEILREYLPSDRLQRISGGVDADNFDSLVKVIGEFKPDQVINCIGIIKQHSAATEHIPALSVNSLFPHRLAMLCKAVSARLIHVSSDCVFDGLKGNYQESDPSNASDLYGRTKFLGEVDYCHCVTLRTSIIGHELGTHYGLVEWFLQQTGTVQGYTKAIFSGFSTIELADIIINHVIPNPELRGLYHVSSDPISKCDLLKMIAEQYGIETGVEPYYEFVADRSLDSRRFRQATGYAPPKWELMIQRMHLDFTSSEHYYKRQTS
ncbi:dTDP-4-dehydrorhamnose reductase family protein [Geobacter argillaceus]|uniref:dTDP-4-dehydrorhamnose reductase n=1 Tax=Geobacter argillaceus TaxID=345631 RepID=A0A562VLQ9_9BACT|nr:SDR family oxidoreductase [Geobacter argillaceus]TWJ18859.1 dTDP-4-dehydrorhamnose reductase [Geobacter argillaceus]